MTATIIADLLSTTLLEENPVRQAPGVFSLARLSMPLLKTGHQILCKG